MKKYAIETFPAYEVTVRMEGDVQTYAMNFLHIFNNVKTDSDLIRVTNGYNNDVFVVCKEDTLDTLKQYLSQFGDITNVDKVLCAHICEDIDYDYEEYWDLVLVPYQE